MSRNLNLMHDLKLTRDKFYSNLSVCQIFEDCKLKLSIDHRNYKVMHHPRILRQMPGD